MTMATFNVTLRATRLGRPRRVALGAVVAGLVLGGSACHPRSASSTSPAPAPSSAPPPEPPSARGVPAIAEMIYDGGLRPGWTDGGGGQQDISTAPARLKMDNMGSWTIAHAKLTTRYGALALQLRAVSGAPSFLTLKLGGDGAEGQYPEVAVQQAHVSLLPDGWSEIVVPWSLLNPSNVPFDRITLHAQRIVGSEPVEVDKIGLVAFDPSKPSITASSARNAMVSVQCTTNEHPISPFIYGVAAGYDTWDSGATARRWGGNPNSRYNWQIDAFNLANDWYFENVHVDVGYRQYLDDAAAHGLRSALTIPTIGWVAKDTSSFGFPASAYSAQKSFDPYKKDAGNGVRPDDRALKSLPPTQTSVAAPPSMMAAWVQAIREHDEKAGRREVDMYILDNEPNIWDKTHRDVHPDPLSYDELLERTVQYATAIRGADPGGLIAGPAEWGWPAYFDSEKDAASGNPLHLDRLSHGGMYLIPWYLKQLQAHQKRTGTRLLDVLDVHYYPQADGVYGPNVDPKTAALRIRSTRSLWDVTYRDESWIADYIRLLPRLKEWIGEYYPGLKISIGEYNFGGEQHMSGALAEAEALGRFGEAGIDYAFYWTFPPKGSPAYWAFRAFRNFDGKGGHFLDRSTPSRGDETVSVFSSRDEGGKHLVSVLLNTNPDVAVRATLLMTGCARPKSRHRYVYQAGSESLVDQGLETTELDRAPLPPYSITVLDALLE